jgi:hypothetical protein
MYSSPLSLTSTLDGVGDQCHDPVALRPGKTRYPLCSIQCGTQCRSGGVRKISSPPGFDPHDCGTGTFLKTVIIHALVVYVSLILF